MKQKCFRMLLTAIIAIFSISSCKKNEPVSTAQPGSGYGKGTSLLTLNLTAGRWFSDPNGFYVATFQNIIPASYSNYTVKVYLVKDNNEIQINNYIYFMGGELWAAAINTDVKIYFQYGGQPLPFSYLNIKIVVE